MLWQEKYTGSPEITPLHFFLLPPPSLSRLSLFLLAEYPPDVVNLTLSNILPISVDAMWSVMPTSFVVPLTRFEFLIEKVGGGDPLVHSSDVTATDDDFMDTIRKLDPGTEYTVEAYAHNEYNRSRIPFMTNFSTPSGKNSLEQLAFEFVVLTCKVSERVSSDKCLRSSLP